MRYLIIGGGSVTAEYYLPALTQLGRAGEVTVVDPEERSIAALRSAFGGVKYINEGYSNFLGALAPPTQGAFENVIIALPNQFHVDAARMALELERNVLCEKPLALKASECAHLRKLALIKGHLLKVAMSRRYLPALMLTRQIVRSKELGEVKAIELRDCTPFLWRPRSFAFFARESGGVLADMGVHYLDFLDTLVGKLKPVSYADDARGGTESSLRYRLAAGDIPIDMRLSRLEQSGAFIRISCDKGEIRVEKSNEADVTVTPCGSKARRVYLEQPFDDAAWPSTFHGSFCQMIADFERAISGAETKIADAADAERAAALIEWAYNQRIRSTPRPAAGTAGSVPKTKVLVTGATGFIGGHLVERLGSDNCDVRVTLRSPGSCANIARFPVEMMPTDLLDKRSVCEAVSGVRTVFHLAYGKNSSGARSITIEGTKNVVQAAIEASADCVVILSTMYVFGLPETSRPVDESFPYRPYGGEYGSSKAIMERWCLAQSRASGGTRIVILNPTCVFGPGGGAYTSLPVDLARNGQFCWINEGTGLCNYSYVGNLIEAILAAALVPEAHGNRFIINDGTISWREFLEPLIRPIAPQVHNFTPSELQRLPRYGEPLKFADLVSAVFSAPEVRRVAKRSATVRKLFDLGKRVGLLAANDRTPRDSNSGQEGGTLSQLPPEWLASLYSPARTVFSAEKAREILNWQPKVDLARAQALTIQWLVDTGRLPATSSVEH